MLPDGGWFRPPPFPDAPFRWRGATKVFDAKSRREATQMRRFCGIILAVALSTACIAAGRRADGGRHEGLCASMVCADAGGVGATPALSRPPSRPTFTL